MRVQIVWRVAIAALAVSVGLGPRSHAADIVIQPASQTNANATNAPASSYNNTINDSGLLSPLATGDAVPAIWPAHSIGDTSTAPTTPKLEDVAGRNQATSLQPIDFHLGGTFNLTGMALWNYSERWGGSYYNNRGMKDFSLAFSTDNGATYSAPLSLTAAIVPNGASTGPDSYAPQLFALSQTKVTDVRLTAISNQGGNFTGFSEIAFTGSQVPEPAAIVLAALAACTLLRRAAGKSCV